MMIARDCEFVCRLVRERSGIVLNAGKNYLIEARLKPLADKEGIGSLALLLRKLRDEPKSTLTDRVVDAMTTKESYFFRDSYPFEILRKEILPELHKERREGQPIQIWCAASSMGQEPYSIAMTISEMREQLPGREFRLIASDISEVALARCREGTYSQIEVNRGVSPELLEKYFVKQGIRWQVKQQLRDMIEFKHINLVETLPLLPRFDIVMVRNVLIYFEVDIKREILRNVRRLLVKNGVLFLGSGETTVGVDKKFKRVQDGKAAWYRLTQ